MNYIWWNPVLVNCHPQIGKGKSHQVTCQPRSPSLFVQFWNLGESWKLWLPHLQILPLNISSWKHAKQLRFLGFSVTIRPYQPLCLVCLVDNIRYLQKADEFKFLFIGHLWCVHVYESIREHLLWIHPCFTPVPRWIAINRLSTQWIFDVSDKMQWEFFQVVALSVLEQILEAATPTT